MTLKALEMNLEATITCLDQKNHNKTTRFESLPPKNTWGVNSFIKAKWCLVPSLSNETSLDLYTNEFKARKQPQNTK